MFFAYFTTKSSFSISINLIILVITNFPHITLSNLQNLFITFHFIIITVIVVFIVVIIFIKLIINIMEGNSNYE